MPREAARRANMPRMRRLIAGLIAAALVTSMTGSASAHGERPRDSVAETREDITIAVKAGYESRDDLIRFASEDLARALGGRDVMRLVTRMVDRALADQRKREQGWKTPTDCDRLARAFAALERSGIVARQNFSDCTTCGVTEIKGEMDDARKAGKRVRGYVFFHEQDVEHAVEDGALYLSYGAAESSEAAQLAIAREVVASLKQAGLDVAWSGRLAERIGLSLEWKRRRFTRPPGG